MVDNDVFKRVKDSIITDPAFMQLVFEHENTALFHLRPEHPDELFNELKKSFEECLSDNYKVEWRRIDDGDDGGDYVKFIITRLPKQSKSDIVKTINVSKDFSDAPVGVFRSDSNYSAEAFREDILIPALGCGHVKVDLSGTCGYGASWLQGVFGTLYTCNQFHEKYLDNHLEVYASDPKDRCYLDAVHRYIDEAKKANATRNKKVTLDEQLVKLVKAMNLVNQAYWWFLNNDYNELAVETSMRIERDIGQLISDINDTQRLKEEQ